MRYFDGAVSVLRDEAGIANKHRRALQRCAEQGFTTQDVADRAARDVEGLRAGARFLEEGPALVAALVEKDEGSDEVLHRVPASVVESLRKLAGEEGL